MASSICAHSAVVTGSMHEAAASLGAVPRTRLSSEALASTPSSSLSFPTRRERSEVQQIGGLRLVAPTRQFCRQRPAACAPTPTNVETSTSEGSTDSAATVAAAIADCPVKLESDAGASYELLRQLLAEGEYEKADDETRLKLCQLAGEGAAKRKWVYFSEVQFIPTKDLRVIDKLWRHFSNDKFGYSVQRQIWNTLKGDWGEFFQKIDWTTEKNRSYRKWPQEYIYTPNAAKGHLPLTNALRGTQLLEAIFKHPAFSGKDASADDGKATNMIDALKKAAAANPFARFGTK